MLVLIDSIRRLLRNLRVLRVDIDGVKFVDVALRLRWNSFILLQCLAPVLESALTVSLACVAYGLIEQLLP